MSRLLPLPPQEIQKERSAEEGGDDADGQLAALGEEAAGEGVRPDHQDGPRQGGQRQHGAVVGGPGEAAGDVGGHQADKADDPGEGHGGGGQEGAGDGSG